MATGRGIDAATLTGYGDDSHDPDYYQLEADLVGTTATDLLFQDGNGGGLATGPLTPNNYTAKIEFATLENSSSTSITATLQATNPTSGVTFKVAEFQMAAGSTQVLDQMGFRTPIPSGFKFQAKSSYTTSLTVVAFARISKGGS